MLEHAKLGVVLSPLVGLLTLLHLLALGSLSFKLDARISPLLQLTEEGMAAWQLCKSFFPDCHDLNLQYPLGKVR